MASGPPIRPAASHLLLLTAASRRYLCSRPSRLGSERNLIPAFGLMQQKILCKSFNEGDCVKKAILLAVFCAFFALGMAQAQQFDVAFGLGTVTGPDASSASGDHFPQSITGGAYPSFSGDFLLKGRLGVQGEIAWRASQALFAGIQPYRPLFIDFNGIWIPQLGKSASAELMAGIGLESARFYQNGYNCSGFTGTCTNYVSSNHFLGHFGGGIRYYFWGNAFIRPEAHLYLVHNNVEFSSGRVTRFGASLGYTFGAR